MPCAASLPTSKPGRPRYRMNHEAIRLSHTWGQAHVIQDFQRMRDHRVGAPARRDRPPRRGSRRPRRGPHAGRARGLHVAQVVADVDAGRRRAAPSCRGRMQQRIGMRLGARRGVAADDARRAAVERRGAPSSGQVNRSTLLVTTPHGRPRASSAASSSAMPGKSRVSDADVLRVELEELLAQRVVLARRSGVDAEAGAEHAARARGGDGPRDARAAPARGAASRAAAGSPRAPGRARCRRACRRGRRGRRGSVVHAPARHARAAR